MPAPRPLPHALRLVPFSVSEARRRGVPAHRLRDKDLATPFQGVRTTMPPGSIEERSRALVPVLDADTVVSHRTAGVLWGLPLPWRLTHSIEVHVTTFGHDRAMRRLGVVGHRSTRRPQLERLRGVPLTSPQATWAALATELTLDELIIVGDAIVGWLRLGHPADLRAAITPGIRGARNLRAAIEEIREGSASPGETLARLVLTRGGLPEPVCNHDVLDERGRFLGRVDLAWPEARVAVEYEGDGHRTDRRTFRSDIMRIERFKDAGWWTVRVTPPDIRPPALELIARIERLLRERT